MQMILKKSFSKSTTKVYVLWMPRSGYFHKNCEKSKLDRITDFECNELKWKTRTHGIVINFAALG